MRRYEELKQRREERIKNAPRPTKKERDAQRKLALEKAHEAKRLKIEQRRIVEQKVNLGQPITEAERELLLWRPGRKTAMQVEEDLIAQSAKVVIKPQSVTELRVLVEKTARKHSYNPIEELILQTQSDEIPEKEKIAIHKALLPFLVPQLAAPKAPKEGAEEGSGIKVVVAQFQFPAAGAKPAQPLYTEKPATVDVEQEKA